MVGDGSIWRLVVWGWMVGITDFEKRFLYSVVNLLFLYAFVVFSCSRSNGIQSLKVVKGPDSGFLEQIRNQGPRSTSILTLRRGVSVSLRSAANYLNPYASPRSVNISTLRCEIFRSLRSAVEQPFHFGAPPWSASK